jgi:hypothetical protein
MSRWPDDPSAYRPSPGWLGIGVVLIMLAIFAVLGSLVWTSAHHHILVTELTGDWAQPGHRETRLSIAPDTQTYGQGEQQVERQNGDLLMNGSIAGQPVGGRVVVSRFPPWGSTLHATLLGRSWSLRSERGGAALALVDDSGHVTRLVRVNRWPAFVPRP